MMFSPKMRLPETGPRPLLRRLSVHDLKGERNI